jgi:hypothetical protein
MGRSIRKRGSVVVFAAAMLSCAAAVLLGQAKDSIVGTWQLDRSKSDFMPQNNLRERTMVFQAVDNGLSCAIRTVSERGDGRVTMESTYTARFDGKDAPIDSSALDTVSLKRIDGDTIERTGKIRGKAVETATMKVSGGGKVLTVTSKGMIDGDAYSSTQVFDKQ